MKSKKLIELLKEVDPTGEVEVCVGNCDIRYVDMMPAYYDGKLQTLKYDDEDMIIGGKYHTKGSKIKLVPYSISDAISWGIDYDEREIEIDYSELSDITAKEYKECNDKTKTISYELHEALELKMFKQWVYEQVYKKYPIEEDWQGIIEEFFDDHLSAYLPFPEDISKPEINPDGTKFWDSYHNRRIRQWEREIKIDWAFGLSIKRIAGMDMKPKLETQKFTHYKDWKFREPTKPEPPKPTFWEKIKKKLTNLFK